MPLVNTVPTTSILGVVAMFIFPVFIVPVAREIHPECIRSFEFFSFSKKITYGNSRRAYWLHFW